MSADEHVPSEEDAVDNYVAGRGSDDPGLSLPELRAEYGPEFDRFLARVRRDAVERFIEACRGKLDEPGFLLPSNYWEDLDAAIRVAESYVKNCPEETL